MYPHALVELVGFDTVAAWAAAGAEYLERDDDGSWWTLYGKHICPSGLYRSVYPKLYKSSELRFNLPDLDSDEWNPDMSAALFIVSNQITCTVCNETIWSASTHDFKRCKCGSCSIDGGNNYLKRTGDYIEQSIQIDRRLAEALHSCYGLNNPNAHAFMPSRMLWMLYKLEYFDALACLITEGEENYLLEKANDEFYTNGKLYDAMKNTAKSESEAGKNSWGIILAMFRTIRDSGYSQALEKLVTRIKNEDIDLEEIVEFSKDEKYQCDFGLNTAVDDYFKERSIYVPRPQHFEIIKTITELTG